jgi:hypothetical protein
MVAQRESQSDKMSEVEGGWGGAGAVMEDPEELRVLYAALDSF